MIIPKTHLGPLLILAAMLGSAIVFCAGVEAQFVQEQTPYSYGPSDNAITSNAQGTGRIDSVDEFSLLRSQIQQFEQELAELRSRTSNGSSSKRQAISPQVWYANYENVIVQPLQSNDTAMIVETATGFTHVPFPWLMAYSPRVQFGLEGADDKLGWRVRYWQFDATKSFDANAGNQIIPVGREATVGYLSEDGDITTGLAFIESGTFTSLIKSNIIDWEIHRKLLAPVDFYAGIRYAKLGQIYSASTDQGNSEASTQFRGLGPTVALGINHSFPDPRFSMFANLRGSLLFGQKDYGVSDSVNNIQQDIGAVNTRDFKDGIDTLAGNAEIQLGARFNPAKWFAASVALEAQHFSNVGGPNPSAVFLGPDSGIAGGNPAMDSLSFVGLNIGTQFMW